jgi:hypothetical protein
MAVAERAGAPWCADLRQRLGERVYATAPERAASWLLVEHPGPWPSLELPDDIPPIAAAVLDRGTEVGVRPQLIRRLTSRAVSSATVIVASCRPGQTWLERRTVASLDELAQLDLDDLAAGRRPHFGALSTEPVVLVCTHGKRDVCCAKLGRPLAGLLEMQLPGQVWETTHVGGDRFAPNVVALPDGSYHGGVALSDVSALADAVTTGRVLPKALRGRAGLPLPVQAADYFVREQLAIDELDAVRPVSSTAARGGEVCVELLVGDERWSVQVRSRRSQEARLTSCADGGTVDTPSTFELVTAARLAQVLPSNRHSLGGRLRGAPQP